MSVSVYFVNTSILRSNPSFISKFEKEIEVNGVVCFLKFTNICRLYFCKISVMRVTIFTLNRNNGIKDIQEKERRIFRNILGPKHSEKLTFIE